MELIAWLPALKGDSWVWGPLPAPSLGEWRLLPVCREGGQDINYAPFPSHEVHVDDGGSRETSTQCILITSAALKEFPQIIFSALHPPHPPGSRLPCAGAQCAHSALKKPRCWWVQLLKTEALTLSQGLGGVWADWIFAVWLSLQSGALPPQLWTSSLWRGSGVSPQETSPRSSPGPGFKPTQIRPLGKKFYSAPHSRDAGHG